VYVLDLTAPLSAFSSSGVDIPSLNLGKQWQFTPGNFREGQIISGGDIFGTVRTPCAVSLLSRVGPILSASLRQLGSWFVSTSMLQCKIY
jgi:vacuolar-type H+-ATPase catalytic subunit A/Vma1